MDFHRRPFRQFQAVLSVDFQNLHRRLFIVENKDTTRWVLTTEIKFEFLLLVVPVDR